MEMFEINQKIEEKIEIILKNEIPDDFNDFAIEFYLLTKKILISLNKFLNLRKINSPKILQIKNAGELLYRSKDSFRIKAMVMEDGFEDIPNLTPKIAYYIIKKNKYTLEDNWKNIIKVLKYNINPTNFFVKPEIKLSEEEKLNVKKDIIEKLNIEEHELNWVINTLKKIKSKDKDLFEKFKAML